MTSQWRPKHAILQIADLLWNKRQNSTIVLRRGVKRTHKQFSSGCSKTCSQGVKLLRVPLSSSFSLILTKKFEPTPFPGGRVSFQSWEVKGGLCNSVILKFGYFENIWSDMHSKLFASYNCHFLTYLAKAKNPKKIACYYNFLRQKSVFHILNTK